MGGSVGLRLMEEHTEKGGAKSLDIFALVGRDVLTGFPTTNRTYSDPDIAYSETILQKEQNRDLEFMKCKKNRGFKDLM